MSIFHCKEREIKTRINENELTVDATNKAEILLIIMGVIRLEVTTDIPLDSYGQDLQTIPEAAINSSDDSVDAPHAHTTMIKPHL